MLYFIPAWYKNDNRWEEKEQNWHVRRMHTEYDDTVKQIQLFHRNNASPYKILLLSYTPNFRHFLHRQGVFHAPYWSCFDAIQEVERTKAALLSFHNLDWPKNTEFVYSPFAVLAYLNGEKFAKIEFGEDGNPIEIDMYVKDEISRRNIYDDRGFLSATIIFENGQPKYTDFLTEKGYLKMRVYENDKHVEVNPSMAYYLLTDGETVKRVAMKSIMYGSLDDLILEVLKAHAEAFSREDIFCVAMHSKHNSVVSKALDGHKIILSFFGDRYKLRNHPEDAKMIKNADYVITESKETSDFVNKVLGIELQRMIDISPFDTRIDQGISQQLHVQKILVPVDDLPSGRFEEMVPYLAEYLSINEHARIHIFTRNAEFGLPDKLLVQVKNILEDYGYPTGWAIEEKKDIAENDFDDLLMEDEEIDEVVPIRFFVEQCVSELEVSKCMREQRIMVDMSEIPDLYLQINCVSTGIPQIVKRETPYSIKGQNAIIVEGVKELIPSLKYYLDGLTHWNEAMIASFNIGSENTTKNLLNKWKEVIETIGKG